MGELSGMERSTSGFFEPLEWQIADSWKTRMNGVVAEEIRKPENLERDSIVDTRLHCTAERHLN